jgi:hypothetical protein
VLTHKGGKEISKTKSDRFLLTVFKYYSMTILRKKLFLLGMFFCAQSIRAQEVKNSIKFEPLAAIFRTASVSYERAISDKSSLGLGFLYTNITLYGSKYDGYAITPEYKFYTKGNAIKGVYLAPFARYQDYLIKNETDKGSLKGFGGGILLGRQWIYRSGFTLDLFFGPIYNTATYKPEFGNQVLKDNTLVKGMSVRAGVSIGVSF